MNKTVKIIIAALSLTAIILGSYFMGNISATTVLGEQRMDHDKLAAEIAKKNAEIEEKNSELVQLDEQLSGLKVDINTHIEDLGEVKDDYKSAVYLVNQTETLQTDVAKLDDQVKEKEKKVASLDGTIQTKQTELDGLIAEKEKELNALIKEKEAELAAVEGAIQKKKDSPKTLPAGVFIVGQDIPAARYSASMASGSDNFVVYTDTGNLKVNTILGSDYGVPEYIFYANDGDVIENGAPTIFTPIE